MTAHALVLPSLGLPLLDILNKPPVSSYKGHAVAVMDIASVPTPQNQSSVSENKWLNIRLPWHGEEKPTPLVDSSEIHSSATTGRQGNGRQYIKY